TTFNESDFEIYLWEEEMDLKYDLNGNEIAFTSKTYILDENGEKDYFEGKEVINEYWFGLLIESRTAHFRIDEEGNILFYQGESRSIQIEDYNDFDQAVIVTTERYLLTPMGETPESGIHDGLENGHIFINGEFNTEWQKVSGSIIITHEFDGLGKGLVVETNNYQYIEYEGENIRQFIDGTISEKQYDQSGRVILEKTINFDFVADVDDPENYKNVSTLNKYYTRLAVTQNTYSVGIPSYISKAVTTNYQVEDLESAIDPLTIQPDNSVFSITSRSTVYYYSRNFKGQALYQITENEVWSDAYSPGSFNWTKSDIQRQTNDYDRYGRMILQKTESLYNVGGRLRSGGWTVLNVLNFDPITDKPTETITEFYTLIEGEEEYLINNEEAFDASKYENIWGKHTLTEYDENGNGILIITDNYKHLSSGSEDILLIDGTKTVNQYIRNRNVFSDIENYRYTGEAGSEQKELISYMTRENIEFQGKNPALTIVNNYRLIMGEDGEYLDGFLDTDSDLRDDSEFELIGGKEIVNIKFNHKGEAIKSIEFSFQMADGVMIYNNGQYVERKHDIHGHVYDSRSLNFDLIFNESLIEQLITDGGDIPGLDEEESALIIALFTMKQSYEEGLVPYNLFLNNNELFESLIDITSGEPIDNVPHLEGEDESQFLELLTRFLNGETLSETESLLLIDSFNRAFPDQGINTLEDLNGLVLSDLVEEKSGLAYFIFENGEIKTLSKRFIEQYNA
ncbi:hypothetical protein BVX93_01995, partial [bacterium B13(2017)]